MGMEVILLLFYLFIYFLFILKVELILKKFNENSVRCIEEITNYRQEIVVFVGCPASGITSITNKNFFLCK